jgi:Protein of unknown function (DUF3047)
MRTAAIPLVVALLLCPRPAAALEHAALVLADFEQQTPALFPAGWKARDAATAQRVYRVVREHDQQFLRAVAHAESAQIALPVSVDLARYPALAWRWRISELPAGADERKAGTNDSAAGVYVVFRGGFLGLLPQAIKYVWSAREPAGAAFASPGYPNARIVVLRSGRAGIGTWQTETVAVAADYRRLFEREPPALQGIAVLTDADDTHSRAAAAYDDFRALPLVLSTDAR